MSLYESLCEKMDGHLYSEYWMSWCPFHEKEYHSHTPSFMVHIDGFYCKSCHKQGSLKYLASIVGTNYSPPPREKVVLPHFRMWSKYGDLDDIATHAHHFLMTHMEFAGYLKDRKVDEFIKQGKLGYLDGWIVIPVFGMDGDVIDIVARAMNNKGNIRYVLLKAKKDEEPPLYCPNWERVKKVEKIYCPFGIFDSVSFELLGLPCVTGTSGTSVSLNRLRELSKEIIFVPDRGEESEAYKLANRMGWRGDVKRLKYPDGTKDSDEVRVKFGNQKLLELINEDN